jgi:hypothetical protein
MPSHSSNPAIQQSSIAVFALLALTAILPSADPVIPPSPSTVSGARIWPDPAFTHWPAVAYDDEKRSIAFSVPVRNPGSSGSIGWQGQTAIPLVLPGDVESASGLLELPLDMGIHRADVRLVGQAWTLRMRVASVREAWPCVRLVNGFPVDADGVPTVLLDHRRDAAAERRFGVLADGTQRPTGRAWLVGDALAAMGTSTWDGLDADAHPATDERFPQHAVLVALAALPADAAHFPRTIVWSPGNQVLYGGAWSAEEERLMGALVARCAHVHVRPLLVLALPPLPVESRLRAQADERRALLARSAMSQDWIVVDLAESAGNPAAANRWSEGVTTRYPLGDAQAAMRTRLAGVLER